MGKKKEEEKEKLGISKRLAKRMMKVVSELDSDCEFASLNDDILEIRASKEIALMRRLINGELENLFCTVEGHSFDIGFMMGYATAQISDIPNRRFKATIEDVKKLIMDRGALPKTQNS